MQKYLTDLLEKHQYDCKHTIYIIGSGPSLRIFPIDYLEDKFTIGLNEAYKSLDFKPTINITIHPRIISPEAGVWLTKIKDNVDVSNYYLFDNKDDLTLLKREAAKSSQSLYCGRGIQTSGLHLAARLGASYAILVGVDMAALGGDHHASDQPTQFHNINYHDVYKEYYYYTVKVREVLEKEFSMKTLYLSGIVGEIDRQQDYIHQLQNKGLDSLPKPQEIETAKRKSPVVREYL